jgi:hypothetical protein
MTEDGQLQEHAKRALETERRYWADDLSLQRLITVEKMLAALKNQEHADPTFVVAKKLLLIYRQGIGYHDIFEWAKWYLVNNGYLSESDCDWESEDNSL